MTPGVVEIAVWTLTEDGRVHCQSFAVSSAEWLASRGGVQERLALMVNDAAYLAHDAKMASDYAAGPKGYLP